MTPVESWTPEQVRSDGTFHMYVAQGAYRRPPRPQSSPVECSPPRPPRQAEPRRNSPHGRDSPGARPAPPACCRPAPPATAPVVPRSEEHTSALQSLMRISYAVFCLKKKNTVTADIHIDSRVAQAK